MGPPSAFGPPTTVPFVPAVQRPCGDGFPNRISLLSASLLSSSLPAILSSRPSSLCVPSLLVSTPFFLMSFILLTSFTFFPVPSSPHLLFAMWGTFPLLCSALFISHPYLFNVLLSPLRLFLFPPTSVPCVPISLLRSRRSFGHRFTPLSSPFFPGSSSQVPWWSGRHPRADRDRVVLH